MFIDLEVGRYAVGRIDGVIFVTDGERIVLFDSWAEAMLWLEEDEGEEDDDE